MNKKYDISTLLNVAFGINQKPVYSNQSANNNVVSNGINYDVQVVEDDIEVERLSYLGTPIVYPLTLSGKLYNHYDQAGNIVQKRLESFEMPAVTLTNFRQSKIISETPIVSGVGSVIETYGFQSWDIEIRGLCLADPSHPTAKTAFTQHLELIKFKNVVDSIPVISKLYNDKGIDNIAIFDVDFGQIEGHPGIIPFLITARSNEAAELVI